MSVLRCVLREFRGYILQERVGGGLSKLECCDELYRHYMEMRESSDLIEV